MSANRLVKTVSRTLGGTLVFFTMLVSAHAAATSLSTEPITSSSTVSAKPNILFVLDDSGSMKADFLPDWAGPYQATIGGVLTVVTPAHRFYNGGYNGVAYNPGTRYRPPSMFDSTGALDTTTYPSQTGQSTATGGDASATVSAPNWRAVKVDGYGIQSTLPANLEGSAFSYVSVAGEYCDSAQLRNCIAASAPSGIYTFPAKLRWCTTSALAADTTVNAGTNCQASNIDDTATNIANGVTPYIYARMPRPRTATISVSIAGTVTGITVDGAQILSAIATGTSSTDLATDIAEKINACTSVRVGVCAAVGYSAVTLANAVTITAPGATVSTPVVIGGTTTSSAFGSGSIPGASLFTVIQPNRTASIRVGAAGTVTNVSVDGQKIISGNATGLSSAELATDIVAKINACTFATVSACTVAGYSAVSLDDVITVLAPGATVSSPVVTGVAATSSVFSGGFFPYPGTSTKNSNRADCAGTTCTYAEEMTNYANWYTYYRTRMQMMKTSASLAFSNVDDKFRVGYFSINNGAGSQFLDLNAFDGTQKNLWYSKFFSAVPFGATPLRSGLSNAGRIYAGKLTALNGVSVADPIQYSCQQNFTILSTDGYWNDTTNPKQIDGVTDIGEQDGSLPRPYYDGGTQTRTVSQTTKTDEQVGINIALVESMTRQQQTTTTPLTESTFNLESRTYPLKSDTQQLLEQTFNLESTPQILQSSTYLLTKVTTPLQQSIYNITVTTSPLQSTTTLVNSTPYKLESTTTLVNSTTAPLMTTTALLNSTTAPLQSTTTLVNSTPYKLESTTTLVNSTPYKLESTTTLVNSTPYKLESTTTLVNSTPYKLESTTTLVNSTPYKLESTTTLVNSTPYALQSTTTLLNSTTSPLQSTTSLINSTTYALLSSTYKLRSSTRQLQKYSEISTDGGDTWDETGWVNVSSCTVAATGPGYTRNTQCRYDTAVDAGGLNTCATVAASPGPTSFSVGQAVTCAYETSPVVASVGACTVVSQPNVVSGHYEPSVSCAYSASSSSLTGQSSCTANNQTGAASMTGNKVVCAYDAPSAPVAAATCTPTVTNTAALPQITCGYGTATPKVTGLSACTAKNQPTSAAMSGDKVVCAYDAASAPVAVASCSPTITNTGALPIITCGYNATAGTKLTAQDTCTANDQPTTGAMTGDKVVCAFDAPSTPVAVGSCTPTVSPTTAAKKITCGYNATAGTKLTAQDTCTAKDQPTTGAMTGDKVVCAFDAPSTPVAVGSCTPTVSPTTAAKKITCGYNTTAGTTLTAQDTCTAKNQPTTGAMTGDKVVCAFDAPSTPVAVGSCTPTVSPTTAAKKITCGYNATAGTTLTGLNTCTAKDQPTTGAMTGDKVVCAFDASSTPVAVGSCTPTASPTTAAKKITCGYNATAGTTQTGLNTCTAKDQPTTGAMTGDKVVCAFDAPSTPVAVGSCTPTVSPTTAAKKITCGYNATAGTTLTGLNTCTAKDQATTGAMTGDKVVCAFDAPSTPVAAGTCTPTVSPTTAAKKVTCGYGTPGTTVHNLNTCAANNQATTGAMTGDQVICGYDPASTPAPVVGTCTPAPATGSLPAVTCGYGTPGTTVHNLDTCVANNQATTGPMTGSQVICAFDAPSTPVAAASCTPTASPTTAAKKITCGYNATAGTTLTGLNTCTAKDQPTTGAMSGDKVVCAFDAPSTPVAVGSCTPTASPTTAAKKITCGYNATAGTKLTAQDTCTAKDQPTTGAMTGDKVVCAFDAASAPVAAGACTPTVSPTTAAKKITCGYGSAGTPLPGQTSCSAKDQPITAAMTGDKVVCAYDATPSTTVQTSCTATSPNTAALPKTTCAYGSPSTLTDQTECTKADASPGPTNYAGPAVSCTYQSAVLASNQTSCTAGAASSAPNYSSYSTCAYVAGTKTGGLSSCSYVAKTGPVNFSGPANDCAYSATSTDVVKTSCSPIAPSATFSAPAKACGYSTTVTTATGLSTCTNVPKSTADPFVGPNVSCYYGTTASATTLNASTCTANRQTASPYSGPAIDCVYNATPVVVSNVGSCTAVAPSAGPTNYSGPAVSCANDVASITTIDTPTCTPSVAAVPPAYAPIVTCSVTNPGMAYVPVAPSCTPVGSLPAGFDETGKIVLCRTTDKTPYTADYPSGLIPVASCTLGTVTDGVTKEQTTCTQIFHTGPDPVQTCNTVNPPVAPSYVKTTCETTTTSSTVMGCAAPLPISPLWQTVSCVENGDGTYNTLADVAAYYYATDLRTQALGNCSGAVVSPATTSSVLCTATDPMNNVRTSTTDLNAFQHMVTYTLGLGASGYMKYMDTYPTATTGDFSTVKGVSPYAPSDGTTANPSNGVCSWQATGLCNWPFPASDEQTTIDDLWHAGVNGHGVYYSAGDPASLSAGISSALNGVAGAGGTAAAPSLSTANLNSTDNYIFSSSYVSVDWTGELTRRRINPYTGVSLTSIDWSAQAKLDANTSRTIYTFDASVASTKLKAFTSANFATNSNFNTPHISTSPTGLTQFLCASSDICLSATDQGSAFASGANLVDYLRGVRTHEGSDVDNTAYYRQRQHVLGDMVNAQTVFVTNPSRDYGDPGYSAFKAAQISRQAVVYAGANDGMLHAFAAKGNATTEAAVDAYAVAFGASQENTANVSLLAAANAAAADAITALANDTGIGQELWAYIPAMVLPDLYRLADKKYRDKHRYFVDATPVVGDICVSYCTDAATAVWKTILVGGLGHGGRGFYALDITNPSSPVALWEFTDTNMGYSYGNPQITKMSDGTWVVLLSSGYNNDDASGGDGVGRLYVLNASSGAQITGVSPISTGYGAATDPSGLTSITALVVDPTTDNTTMAVYGGDLGGNLWRIDINDSVGATGVDAQLLAVLKDGAGNRQPITTKPTVSYIKNQKVVFVGTGRFLDASDATDTSQQTLYAIKDPWTTGGSAATAIFDNPGDDRSSTGKNTKGFVPQVLSWITCPVGTSTSICNPGTQVVTSTKNAVDFISDNGWFVDLINPSERANTNPALGFGTLAFVTNAPSLLACDIGGKSYLYYLNYATGSSTSSPGNPGGVVGYQLANSFASAPAFAVRSTPGGGVGSPILIIGVQDPSKIVIPNTTVCVDGVCAADPGLGNTPTAARRTSWRELITE